MRKIKYIISFILITIVFSFIGEIYVWHVNSFESTYTNVTMYLQKNGSQEQMIKDIYNAADHTNVDVFTVDQEIENIFSTKRIIYGTEGVTSYLKSNSGIKMGDYQSVLIGNVTVEFKSLERIEDISQTELYQVIGEKQDIVEFKKELINQYAGRFPQEGFKDRGNIFFIIVVWGISLSLFLLMTLYEVALVKKEVMIRIIYGENLSRYIIKNIFTDLFVYGVMFISIPLTLSRITTTTYLINISIIAIITFLIFNSLIYILLFYTDYKKDLGSKESSKSVLNLSYAYKVISIVLVIVAMSSCIELIYQGADYYRQKVFFEENKKYSYIGLSSFTFDDDEIYADAYQQFIEKGKVFSLVNLETWETNAEYILGNGQAIEYLQRNIPDISEFTFGEKIYFIIPDHYKDNQLIFSDVEDIWSSYYHDEYDYETVFYNQNANVLHMGNLGKITTGFIRNPIIILNNTSSHDKYWNNTYIGSSSLFDISDDEWNAFITEHQYENETYYKTNAYEHFMHQWQLVKRNMFIGIVLLSVLIILESIIVRTIISYEYRVSATELSLKKVFGYGLFEKHKKILFSTLISGAISLVITAIVFYLIGKALIYILFGGVCFLFIELMIMLFYVHKTDQMNIQKILKGGIL